MLNNLESDTKRQGGGWGGVCARISCLTVRVQVTHIVSCLGAASGRERAGTDFISLVRELCEVEGINHVVFCPSHGPAEDTPNSPSTAAW
jgi:hypothetical protein